MQNVILSGLALLLASGAAMAAPMAPEIKKPPAPVHEFFFDGKGAQISKPEKVGVCRPYPCPGGYEGGHCWICYEH